jgi:hypothetical protein
MGKLIFILMAAFLLIIFLSGCTSGDEVSISGDSTSKIKDSSSSVSNGATVEEVKFESIGCFLFKGDEKLGKLQDFDKSDSKYSQYPYCKSSWPKVSGNNFVAVLQEENVDQKDQVYKIIKNDITLSEFSYSDYNHSLTKTGSWPFRVSQPPIDFVLMEGNSVVFNKKVNDSVNLFFNDIDIGPYNEITRFDFSEEALYHINVKDNLIKIYRNGEAFGEIRLRDGSTIDFIKMVVEGDRVAVLYKENFFDWPTRINSLNYWESNEKTSKVIVDYSNFSVHDPVPQIGIYDGKIIIFGVKENIPEEDRYFPTGFYVDGKKITNYNNYYTQKFFVKGSLIEVTSNSRGSYEDGKDCEYKLDGVVVENLFKKTGLCPDATLINKNGKNEFVLETDGINFIETEKTYSLSIFDRTLDFYKNSYWIEETTDNSNSKYTLYLEGEKICESDSRNLVSALSGGIYSKNNCNNGRCIGYSAFFGKNEYLNNCEQKEINFNLGDNYQYNLEGYLVLENGEELFVVKIFEATK